MAVVDILPGSLSSKYFFWDPGHAWLSLGRLSALLEIEWVRAAGAGCPSLRYYMMGFFIASCSKMSYKARTGIPTDCLLPLSARVLLEPCTAGCRSLEW